MQSPAQASTYISMGMHICTIICISRNGERMDGQAETQRERTEKRRKKRKENRKAAQKIGANGPAKWHIR